MIDGRGRDNLSEQKECYRWPERTTRTDTTIKERQEGNKNAGRERICVAECSIQLDKHTGGRGDW